MKIKELIKERTSLNTLFAVLFPVIFEIANNVSGSWADEKGNPSITVGKFITILIVVIYIGWLVYYFKKEKQEKKEIDQLKEEQKSIVASLKQERDLLEKENSTKRLILSNMVNILGFAKESIITQNKYLEENDTSVRELQIDKFATTICTVWYEILRDIYGDKNITVNIYHRYKRDSKTYYTMIAHEGHITQPKYFGQEKLLKKSRSGNYYCERILLSDNPAYKILLNPDEVAKAFGKSPENCKYKQYVAIPIIYSSATGIKLMVEINIIDETILGDDEANVREMIKELFSCLTEYLILLSSVEEYAMSVDKKLQKEQKK